MDNQRIHCDHQVESGQTRRHVGEIHTIGEQLQPPEAVLHPNSILRLYTLTPRIWPSTTMRVATTNQRWTAIATRERRPGKPNASKPQQPFKISKTFAPPALGQLAFGQTNVAEQIRLKNQVPADGAAEHEHRDPWHSDRR